MTFDKTAWAIDGALLGSSLARRAEFAATGGAQGIVQKGDLKVTQLAVPGVGILISSGVGLVRNEYQTTPSETYVVSNPGSHTVPSASMPGSSGSAKSWLVCVVVGDPDFSQVGHPFMGSDDPPAGQEQTFDYVRVVLIEVAAGTKTLDVAYPALPLARIDIPANTTTITNAMITDLRSLATPRQSQAAFASPFGAWNSASPDKIPAGSAYADWGTAFQPSVQIPSWATRAIVIASVNGVRLMDSSANVAGGIKAQLGTVSGPATEFDFSTGGGAIRSNFQTGGEYDVSAIAGTTATLKVQGYQDLPASPTANQKVDLRKGSQIIFDVRFFEE